MELILMTTNETMVKLSLLIKVNHRNKKLHDMIFTGTKEQTTTLAQSQVQEEVIKDKKLFQWMEHTTMISCIDWSYSIISNTNNLKA